MTSARDLLRTLLTSTDIRTSEAALQELCMLPENDRAARLPDLRAALTHADSLVRCRAVRALSPLFPEPASSVPLLLDRLRDPSWPVREAAAEALGQPGMSWPGLREALVVTVLHDPQKLVRRAAALALAKHPEESRAATEQLVQSLQHPHVAVRARALLALGQLPAHAGESVPHLRKALHASHWRVRLSAAEALGELGAAAVSTAPDLFRRSCDRHPRVSRGAVIALRRIRQVLPASLNDWLDFLRPESPFDALVLLNLTQPELPDTVRLEMQETIRRRQLWQQRWCYIMDAEGQRQEHVWLSAHLFELLCWHAGI